MKLRQMKNLGRIFIWFWGWFKLNLNLRITKKKKKKRKKNMNSFIFSIVEHGPLQIMKTQVRSSNMHGLHYSYEKFNFATVRLTLNGPVLLAKGNMQYWDAENQAVVKIWEYQQPSYFRLKSKVNLSEVLFYKLQ